MTKRNDYDLLVVGAGPGGYVAAIRAAQLGLKTAVIERDRPGGVCLNVGCIPSKALIRQAEIYRSGARLAEWGIKVDMTGFDYGRVQAFARRAADRLSRGIGYLLRKNDIALIAGNAVRVGGHEVELDDGTVYGSASVIVATGSRPRELSGFPIDEKTILSSTGALSLDRLPPRLLILGAGAVGVEFAHIFSSFGVDVRLVEMADQILPLEDEDAAALLASSLRKRGITIDLAARALGQEEDGGIRRVTIETAGGAKTTVETEMILVAVGRRPNTENLGLEAAGVKLDAGGHIVTGLHGETAVDGLYAVGDVTGTPQLAHIASREGELAAEHIAGKTTLPSLDLNGVLQVTYAEPQIASFGRKERDLIADAAAYRKLLFPYKAIGKAVAAGQDEGQIKILLDDKTEEILGAHIVGAEATELIHELLLAKSAELLPDDLIAAVHAHPTLAEGLAEAMRAARDGALHI